MERVDGEANLRAAGCASRDARRCASIDIALGLPRRGRPSAPLEVALPFCLTSAADPLSGRMARGFADPALHGEEDEEE